MIKNIKEKVIGAMGSISGITSILGSWQVCHNVCLGIITLLAIIGITVTGMPLLFLTKVAVPFWILAFVLLLIITYFYLAKHCISKNLIIMNVGLLNAGIPFQSLQNYSKLFWTIGGILIAISVFFFIRDKFRKVKK